MATELNNEKMILKSTTKVKDCKKERKQVLAHYTKHTLLHCRSLL